MLARQSLTTRLILAFTVVSMVGIGLAALMAHFVTVREYERYFLAKNRAEFVSGAAAYYRDHGSWAGVDAYLRLRAPLGGADGRPPPATFAVVDETGVVVSPAEPYRMGQRLPVTAWAGKTAVQVGGRRVGTVLDAERKPTLSDREAQYLASTDRALGLGALGAVALAVLLGVVLARGLAHPLRDLTAAIRAMSAGTLGHQVPVRSGGEVGELTAAFNQMSADLARANELRRQMTADVAHDLRTPLTVITGYIEGLRDGVLAPTPERFEAMQTEAQHLKHLVTDLHTLSLADAGELPLQRGPVSPAALLARVVSAYEHEAGRRGVELTSHVAAGTAHLDADAERLAQVLENLISNALRHTPRGGHVELSAAGRGGHIQIVVRDDGEGIAPEDLPRVFDRFYRADPSRHDSGGEAGLGLAIARSIVTAHGGMIAVASEPGRGTQVTIELPAYHPQPDEEVQR